MTRPLTRLSSRSPLTTRTLSEGSRYIVTFCILLLLGGCAAVFDHAPTLPEKEDPPECTWEIIRGVAVLTATDGEKQLFTFHPGGIEIIKEASSSSESASIDDEFKALLRTPTSGPCQDPELELVDPVGSD